MKELNAAELKRLQGYWARIADKIISQADRSFSDIEQISRDLEEMGLDMKADETYELLAPGLTRTEFTQARSYFALLHVLDSYHQSQKISGRTYVDAYHGQRYHGLKRLLDYSLPALEKALAETGMPAEASPLMQREAQFVLDLYREGALEDDMKRTAQEAACDNFRSASHYAESLKQNEAQGKSYYQESREGLAYANGALNLIKAAGAYYQAKTIPHSYGSFGGWDKKKATIPFSREAAEDLRDFFLVKELGWKFREAMGFQNKGHFVLDASGSGHGMMVLPMQDILLKLEEYGRDIRDPETFREIGTDIDTFWDCYRKERQEAATNEYFSRLAKPELTR